MSELREPGDLAVGERLVAWGRKISKVRVVPGPSVHRAQSVIVWGDSALCRVDIPVRRRR